MTLRKVFLKLTIFVSLTLSGLAGTAGAASFSESFENITDPNGQSSFTFMVSGVSFTASASSNGLWLDQIWPASGYDGSKSIYAAPGPGSHTLTIARTDGQPWTFQSLFVDNSGSGTVTLSGNLATGGSVAYGALISGASGVISAGGSGAAVTSISLTASNLILNYDMLVGDTTASVPPTVTDGRISISGASGTAGAYKVGDTVTATWNNTAGGDNNSSTITGVTVDFSQFGGGAAVAASNSSGTWTATYTIVAGAIDGTNKNVSVTATNSTGSTTTADTTNATVDTIAPTVTDANISFSGSAGTNKIGHTVTATWNNTASGDNNNDTLSAVTVDFS